MVRTILDNLAEGMSAEEVVREYPALTHADVHAVLAFAVDVARSDDVLVLPHAA